MVEILEYFSNILLVVSAVICLASVIFYIFLKRRYKYWKERGIPGPEPVMFFGNMKDTFDLKCTEPEMTESWYHQFRNEKYIGFFNLWKPSIFVRDPDLTKKILETDFDNFMDHPPFSSNKGKDSIVSSLFAMEGLTWKNRRQLFNKAYTPMRLRKLSNDVNYNEKMLIKNIDNALKTGEDIDLSDVLGKHVIRIVMLALYGIDLTNDDNKLLELDKYADIFLHPTGEMTLKFMYYTIAPDLFKFLKLRTFPDILWNYFSSFTMNLLNLRERHATTSRDDLLSLIEKFNGNEASSSERISFDETVSHVFSFFSASHHTTLTTMAYVFYMLAQHPDVQEKVREEIEHALKREENISYDSLQKMPYLEAVLDEVLRLYPLIGILKRVCTKSYQVDEKFTIPKGMDVFFPVQSMHKDPKYFDDPENFKPERFLGSENLIPFAFMPFGKGPRICIGLRFSKVLIMITVAEIVLKYKILPSPRMPHSDSIKYDVRSLFVTCRPKDGVWVRLEKRKNL